MSSPEPDAPRTCAACHKEITDTQFVEHAGAVYCADCVGRALNAQTSRWSSLREDFTAGAREVVRWLSIRSSTGPRNPTLALLLSLLPGVGQMYNGQLRKGVVVIVAFLWLATGGLEGVLGSALHIAAMVALYFWNLFDAYSTAQWANGGEFIAPPRPAAPQQPQPTSPAFTQQPLAPQPAPPTPPVPSAPVPPPVQRPRTPPRCHRPPSRATPAWGVFLIILGVLFLLNNFGVRWMTWDRLWPTALLALGVWMLLNFALSLLKPPSTPTPPSEGNNG